jgi:protein-S-isoprenylcysteine O-methyltransferase Ste14
VDLWLSWAWLWGAVAFLAGPRLHLGWLVLIALSADLVLMPMTAPVITLAPSWLMGEAVLLAVAFIPGQLLARWTARDEHLVARATLQVFAFSGLVMFLLPIVAIEGSGSSWTNPLTRPTWQLSLIVQLLAIPAILGLSAVQEFVTRGLGTPIPYDPPRRMVSSGPYAYVSNPMQLSAVVLLMMLGAVLENPWVAAAGVMAHIYSVGLAGWDEGEDLQHRFGTRWTAYRSGVRAWIPSLRPWHDPGAPIAKLYVSATCVICRGVGVWLSGRGFRGMKIVAAESHPSRALTRMTYDSCNGSPEESGVAALGRALEHVHLGWAFVGFALRLPLVRPFAQLLADASGGEPRPVQSES